MRLKSLSFLSLLTAFLIPTINTLRYDPAYVKWNLNQAKNAVDPLDYTGIWENHQFHPSPSNWRMPFYTIMLDRWVNGDPTNDNANGTIFEQDVGETQLRNGGDILGLKDSLDYLQGMGIKVPLALPSLFGRVLMVGDLFSRYDIH